MAADSKRHLNIGLILGIPGLILIFLALFYGVGLLSWYAVHREIADWLIEQAQKNITFIAGIDHGFSFPMNYFERYKLKSWPQFLDDLCQHWPTDQDDATVEQFRHGNHRTGRNTDFRITEKWNSVDDLKAHFAEPHMATFQAAMADNAPASLDVKFYEVKEIQLL